MSDVLEVDSWKVGRVEVDEGFFLKTKIKTDLNTAQD
jgi:hypothetical protein